MKPAGQRQWTIPATLDEVDEICLQMSAWLKVNNLEEHIFPMQVLVRESLNNAVLHGAGLNPAKNIQCKLWFTKNMLHLLIIDDGPGFDWQAAMQNKLAAGEEEHGRGVWLYHLYADLIKFNACGNQVKLSRRLNKDKSIKDHLGDD